MGGLDGQEPGDPDGLLQDDCRTGGESCSFCCPSSSSPSPPPACQLFPAACRVLGTFSGQEGRSSYGGLGLFLHPSRVSRPQRPWCPQSGMLMIRDEPMAAQLVLSFHVHRRKTTLGHLPHPQAQEGTVGQPPHIHRHKRALWDSLPRSTGSRGHCGTASPHPQAHLEARFPARRREERGCGPVTGKDRASCQNGGAPALCTGAVAPSPGREAALAWASLAQRFPASSVLAREGAGGGSV